MKTSAELIKEVDAELNAVKAADMGLEAAEAFATDALQKFESGDVIAAKDSLTNLVSLLSGLRKAVPANVIPASAGPVGKSPHEQYLEQAATIVADSLAKMGGALTNVQEALKGVNEAVAHANTATAAIKSPDLKAA